MTDRDTFGPHLRQHRERRGLTLDDVAESTKVSRFLLASLERGDVSRWPRGIYRRAFLRAYADAIGLPPEPTLREFLRAFPEPGRRAESADGEAPAAERLSLMPESRWRPRARHVLAAVADSLIVVVVGSVVAIALETNAVPTMGVVATMYYTVGTLLAGRSPVAGYLSVRRSRRLRPAIAGDMSTVRGRWTSAWLDSTETSSERRATTA